MNITPSLLTYASLIITIYYIYAMIGMEIFSNVINDTSNVTNYCNTSKLMNTEFARYT